MVTARYIIAAVSLAYLAVWAVAIVVLALLVIMLVVSRGPVAVLRRLFRRRVAAGAGSGSVHAAARHAPGPAVAAGIRSLRAADPGFDATAFLDGTRMAVGAYAMAIASQDDRLLRRITTPRYWQTPNGKAVADSIAQWKRYAGGRSGTTNQGRVLLDVSWRQPEVTEVALGEQGMDRITVRLGSVIIGAIRQSWRPLEAATLLDWDFVPALITVRKRAAIAARRRIA